MSFRLQFPATSASSSPEPEQRFPLPNQPLKIVTVPNTFVNDSLLIAIPAPVAPTIFDRTPGAPSILKMDIFTGEIHKLAPQIADELRPEAIVDRMLPAGRIPDGARYIAACLLLWLCLIDIISEDPREMFDWDSTFWLLGKLCAQPFADHGPFHHPKAAVVTTFAAMIRASTIEAFDEVFSGTRIQPWKSVFWTEVLFVLKTMKAEQYRNRRKGPLKKWAELSIIRLTVRPFMVLARAGCALEADLRKAGSGAERLWEGIRMIETNIQQLVNTQFDILNWPKAIFDKRTKKNMIEIYLKKNAVHPHLAFSWAIGKHNDFVLQLQEYHKDCEEHQLGWLNRYAQTTHEQRQLFRDTNIYTSVMVAFGNALPHCAIVTGLLDRDMNDVEFPESATRAKYHALELEEEFEALLTAIPDL